MAARVSASYEKSIITEQFIRNIGKKEILIMNCNNYDRTFTSTFNIPEWAKAENMEMVESHAALWTLGNDVTINHKARPVRRVIAKTLRSIAEKIYEEEARPAMAR